MLVQNLSGNLKVVYVANISRDTDLVFEHLNILERNKDVKKDVVISHSSYYYPEGSNKSLLAVKIDRKGQLTYIVSDTMVTDYLNPQHFINEFKAFGSKAILRFNGDLINGNFITHKSNSIKNADGKIINFKNTLSKSETNNIHKFIHYMKTDNGRMIAPLLKRYVNTLLMVKGKKKLLTGYANLRDYLTFIKNPSMEALLGTNEADEEATYFIEVNSGNKRMTLTAGEIIGNAVIVDLTTDNDIKSSDDTESKPYILLNAKPITLMNQKLPYFISYQKNFPVYVTPMLLKSDKVLQNLRGGINLLK